MEEHNLPRPNPTSDQNRLPEHPNLNRTGGAELGSNAPKPPLLKTTRLRSYWLRVKNKWRSFNRWQKSLVVLAALIFFAMIAGGAYLAFGGSSTKNGQQSTVKTPPKPTTVASPLTGVLVAPALAQRPVTSIMIENGLDSRPQSGLQEAGVVVEAIAEGGITRFLALFQEASPQYIGPVRSLRPYYIDFAQGFEASIVHIGGSPDALSRVRNGSYRDLDQFFNANYFTRVKSRFAPHDLYTSFDNLDKLNQSKGYTKSTFDIWPRKAGSVLPVPTAKAIDINISRYYFNVHYDFDPATNTYLRSQGGAAHTNLVSAEDKTGVQLRPMVVIALIMPQSIGYDGQHSNYADTGTGNAYIFQDGGVIVGQWSKADANSQIFFKDSAGNPIRLNAGQAWLSLVSSDSGVAYVP